MKKIFALVIIALTLVGIFCSCGGNENITTSRVERPDTEVSLTPQVSRLFLSKMIALLRVRLALLHQ